MDRLHVIYEGEIIGSRPYMEDRYVISDIHIKNKKCKLIAIFDGHGGIAVCQYLKVNFTSFLSKYLINSDTTDIDKLESIIKTCFLDLDMELYKLYKHLYQGSTCTMTLIIPIDELHVKLCIVNLGDSKTCLYKNNALVFQTIDHNPWSAPEKRRIEACGGRVTNHRIDGILAVSRAFGDFYLKTDNIGATEQKVSPEPDITICVLDTTHLYIVMASDGLWSEKNQNTLLAQIKTHADCKKLMTHNFEDNVTLISLTFNKH